MGSRDQVNAGPRPVDRAVAALKGRNIHVVGLAGTEGSAVVDFLLRYGVTSVTHR